MRAVFTSDLDLEPKWSDRTEPMSREKKAVTDNILHEQTHCTQGMVLSHTHKKKSKDHRPQTKDQGPKTKTKTNNQNDVKVLFSGAADGCACNCEQR